MNAFQQSRYILIITDMPTKEMTLVDMMQPIVNPDCKVKVNDIHNVTREEFNKMTYNDGRSYQAMGTLYSQIKLDGDLKKELEPV